MRPVASAQRSGVTKLVAGINLILDDLALEAEAAGSNAA